MADDSLGEDVVATAGDDPAGGSLQLVDRELTIGSSQRPGLPPAQADDGDPRLQPFAVRVAPNGGQDYQPI
jgi:hypothetical protein